MNRRRRSFRNKALILAAIVAMGALLCIYFFGRFLVVDGTPAPSDAIIVLSGDEGRLQKGVDLMRSGYSEKLIVTKTNGRGRGEISLQSVLATGVPAASIHPDYDAVSTYTNAVNSKRIMQEHGYKSAIVVSSDYHMRRVKYTFGEVYKGSDIRLHYVAAPSKHFDPKRWWSKKIYIKYGVSEYIKLVGYLFLY